MLRGLLTSRTVRTDKKLHRIAQHMYIVGLDVHKQALQAKKITSNEVHHDDVCLSVKKYNDVQICQDLSIIRAHGVGRPEGSSSRSEKKLLRGNCHT